MPPVNVFTDVTALRRIEYLSPPAAVSMADQWFEIASIDHFWVCRRFDVLMKLCRSLIAGAKEMAEIGCGHGLLQRQIENTFNRSTTGFDLNDYALKQNLSQKSRVCCYNIFQMNPSLHEKFDVVFLFDVLEHITDEDAFLKAVLFHLTPQGKLVINVPAGQWAHSSYDVAAGHVRRYSMQTLRNSARRNGLVPTTWSYWGLPLIPTLILRKIWLAGQHDQRKVIYAGFDSRSHVVNRTLRMVSKLEAIPQTLLGTSLMATFQRGVTTGA